MNRSAARWFTGPRARWAWLAAAVILLFASGITRRELDGTTAFYAALSAQIADTGRLAPLLHGDEPYVLKPPLMFWGTAGLYSLFGVENWTSTFLSRLFGLLCIALTARLAYQRTRSATAAWWAALALATTIPFVENAMTFRLDTALIAGILLSMVALGERRASWRPAAFYAGVTLATLAKGFPGSMPLGLALVLAVLDRRLVAPWAAPARPWVLWSVLLLPIPAWYVGIDLWIANPVGRELLRDMVEAPPHSPAEHLWRTFDLVVLSPATRSPHLVVFALLGVGAAISRARRTRSREERAWFLVLVLWVVLVVLAAAIKPAQRVRYVLPATPVLAVWIGAWFATHWNGRVPAAAIAVPVVVAVLGVFTWFMPESWWPANHRSRDAIDRARAIVARELPDPDRRLLLVEPRSGPSGRHGRQWASRDWVYLHLGRDVEPVAAEVLLEDPAYAGRLAVVHSTVESDVPSEFFVDELARTPSARLVRLPVPEESDAEPAAQPR